MKNLRKKYEQLKSQVRSADSASETEESDAEDSEEEEKQAPVKPRAVKQRQGVSAEVFGENNRKGDFVPPVFQKSAAAKEQLKTKLLQAFMFNALDENELNIVLDAVEEVK